MEIYHELGLEVNIITEYLQLFHTNKQNDDDRKDNRKYIPTVSTLFVVVDKNNSRIHLSLSSIYSCFAAVGIVKLTSNETLEQHPASTNPHPS